MKEHSNGFVLFSETDSPLFEIKHTGFREEPDTNIEFCQYFDLSNYPADLHLYNIDNKMVMLEFEDELVGEPIEDMVRLKPKMYSILVGGRQNESAKIVCKFAQKELTHNLSKKFEYGRNLPDNELEKRVE